MLDLSGKNYSDDEISRALKGIRACAKQDGFLSRDKGRCDFLPIESADFSENKITHVGLDWVAQFVRIEAGAIKVCDLSRNQLDDKCIKPNGNTGVLGSLVKNRARTGNDPQFLEELNLAHNQLTTRTVERLIQTAHWERSTDQVRKADNPPKPLTLRLHGNKVKDGRELVQTLEDRIQKNCAIDSDEEGEIRLPRFTEQARSQSRGRAASNSPKR